MVGTYDAFCMAAFHEGFWKDEGYTISEEALMYEPFCKRKRRIPYNKAMMPLLGFFGCWHVHTLSWVPVAVARFQPVHLRYAFGGW
jgi:hypothetical protein